MNENSCEGRLGKRVYGTGCVGYLSAAVGRCDLQLLFPELNTPLSGIQSSSWKMEGFERREKRRPCLAKKDGRTRHKGLIARADVEKNSETAATQETDKHSYLTKGASQD